MLAERQEPFLGVVGFVRGRAEEVAAEVMRVIKGVGVVGDLVFGMLGPIGLRSHPAVPRTHRKPIRDGRKPNPFGVSPS